MGRYVYYRELMSHNVDAVWLVKPATIATYKEQTLIGFINYYRLLAFRFIERWRYCRI